MLSKAEGLWAMMDAQAEAVLREMQATTKPMPANEAEWLEDYRATLDAVVAMQGAPPEIAVCEQDVVVGSGVRLRMRLFRPEAEGLRPTLLFLHGGGFVAGSLAGYDIPLRWLALRSGWQVAAPAYRLAPEHPYPAALDDCAMALDQLLNDPACEVDATRVAIGGDSAGGLLATAVAARARDAGQTLALQVLLYPNTDLREGAGQASRAEFDGVVIRIEELYRSLACYLGGTDRTRPDVSPLLSASLTGLCPALIVTNEYDPLRDEAEAYGAQLEAAGVPADCRRMAGMIHTALQRGARIDAGDALISEVAEVLRRTGARPGEG